MSMFTTGIGTLGRDPEITTTTSGKRVAKFSIAVSRAGGKNADGTFAPMWLQVEVWEDEKGQNLDFVEKYLTKGSSIMVNGTLHESTWEDGDGNKKSKIFLRATSVNFAGGKREDSGGDSDTSVRTPVGAGAAKGKKVIADDEDPFN